MQVDIAKPLNFIVNNRCGRFCKGTVNTWDIVISICTTLAKTTFYQKTLPLMPPHLSTYAVLEFLYPMEAHFCLHIRCLATVFLVGGCHNSGWYKRASFWAHERQKTGQDFILQCQNTNDDCRSSQSRWFPKGTYAISNKPVGENWAKSTHQEWWPCPKLKNVLLVTPMDKYFCGLDPMSVNVLPGFGSVILLIKRKGS